MKPPNPDYKLAYRAGCRQYPGGVFGKMKYTQLYAIYKQRIKEISCKSR